MNHRTLPTRRTMLRGAAAFAAASALPNWYLDEVMAQGQPAAPRSANDTPTFALIGCGGRGGADAPDAQKIGRGVAPSGGEGGPGEGGGPGAAEAPPRA